MIYQPLFGVLLIHEVLQNIIIKYSFYIFLKRIEMRFESATAWMGNGIHYN